MARTIHELVGLITSNVSGFVRGMGRAAKATDQMRDNWLRAGRSIGAVGDRIGLALGAVAVITGKVGIELNQLKASALTSFETMLGSAQRAQDFMADLSEFAKRTPFELPGLIQASQKLLAFGFEAENILPMMSAIGDAVAGLGGDPQVMESVVRALGQIRAKGKASAEEMLQMAEAGIPAWEFLASHLGVTIPEAMDQVTKGAVDAEQTIAAMTAGMSGKFGGLMEKQSKSFKGLLSTLKDNFAQAAASIVEPLFTSLTDLFARINAWAETPEATAFIAQAREQVADLVSQVRDAAPSIMEAAQAFGRLLVPVLEFLKEHPNLVAALLVLKAGQTLGINAALGDLTRAIASTVGAITGPAGLIPAATSLGAALGGGAVLAVALAAIYVGFTTWADGVRSVNDAIETNNRLMDAQARKMDEVAKKALAAGDQDSLQQALERAQAEEERLARQAVADRKTLEHAEADSGLLDRLPGLDPMKVHRNALAETEEQLKAQRERVDALKKALADLGADDPFELENAATDEEMATAVESGMVRGADAAKEKLTKMMEAVVRDGVERGAPGAGRLEELISAGASEGDLRQAMTAQAGPDAGPQVMAAIDAALEQFRLAQNDPHGILQEDDGALLTAEAMAQTLERARVAAEQAASAQALYEDTLESQQARMEELRELDPARADALTAKLDDLYSNFLNGSTTAEQFAASVSQLAVETDKATLAAQREAAEKQRAALLSGDFEGAGLDSGKALQDKIAAFQMQRFNEQVERSFQNWLRVNGHLKSSGDGLERLAKSAERAREEFLRAAQERQQKAQEAFAKGAQAMGTLASFLGTRQGMITAIINNIALLKQTLRLVDDGRRRLQILEQIKGLNEQLVDLMKTSPPFVGLSGDPLFKDPGLHPEEEDGGGVTRKQGAADVVVSLPNVTRFTSADARQAVLKIREETARQGRPV